MASHATKSVIAGAWIVLLAALLWRVTAITTLNSSRSYDLLSRPPLVRLDPRVMRVITLGHIGLYEDVIDIWGLQALMDKRLNDYTPEAVQKMVLDISHQAPRIETFYMLSCFTLDIGFQRPDLCEPFMLDGIRALPMSWRLPMLQGYIEMKGVKDNKAAAIYYGLAASRPLAPNYLQSLSETLAKKGELSADKLESTLSTMINATEGSQLERLSRKDRQAVSLVINDLSKVFKNDLLKQNQTALDHLSCEFPSGRCTGLLGHNGAGKTTTIRAILGLIRPDTGAITYEGAPITLRTRERLGYMPEVNKLPAALTPAEVLEFHLALTAPDFARTRKDRRAAVANLLAGVGLTAHAKKRIGKLSKGMARRVAWTLAVCHKPSLLILDEPSSGLDPLGRRDMMSWIQKEKERGTTIVLCTHELAQVKQLCDELHLLRAGKLVLTSMPRQGVATLGKATRHVVHVAGGDEAALSKLRDKAQLKPWTERLRDGFLSILSLDSHADAMRWVQELTAAGFVVVRFGDEAFAPDEAFLPYFDQQKG